MRARYPQAALRVAVALLGFSAVVTEVATLHERGVFRANNFFSFFTIEGNLFAVVVPAADVTSR